jgi:hypothetical protein
MEFNGNFTHDLKLGQHYEEKLGMLLTNKKIEVKRDKRAAQTGNIYIEFNSRGKPSGIETTEADYWAIWPLEDVCIFVTVGKIRQLVEKYKNDPKKVKAGGDNNTSYGVIVPLEDFLPVKGK